jgi:CRISPR system Cascade subunit CasB
MPPEPQPDRPKLSDTIFQISRTLAGLDPGALADLRRMSLDGDDHGAPYFWRLAALHNFGHTRDQLATWAHIVQIMAILTDKGQPGGKSSPHAPATTGNGWRGLGHALCDGGDLTWGRGDPRPMLSELRLARLLAAKGPMRARPMTRVARALAAKKPPGTAINCTDLAAFLLFPDNPDNTRKLARQYYARLDRATRSLDHDNNPELVSGDPA